MRLCQLRPALDGMLDRLITRVSDMHSAVGEVMSHRPVGTAGAQVAPRALLGGVPCAMHARELRTWRDLGEAIEHATGADRRQLRTITDSDQLGAGALHH